MTTSPVLVTGGSGFIAGHIILQLLDQGYAVRTTVRSLSREAAVRSVLTEAGMVNGGALTFVAADLLSDDGWVEAVDGCRYLLHVASPVQPGHVDNEDDVIVPAREGTLRVLRAARDGGVERVVLTSAFHAVSWGHPHDDHVFTEADWTVLDGPGVDAYGKSKTLAERAAWDFTTGGPMELTTMLPVAVIGPVMGSQITGSNHIVQSMLTGAMPAFPDINIPVVDVRDVAAAHILAMTNPDAAGERFLLSAGPVIPMAQIGAIIRDALGDSAANVPTLAAAHTHAERAKVPDLGYVKRLTNAKARRVLGWEPRDPRIAIVEAAESIVRAGLAAG